MQSRPSLGTSGTNAEEEDELVQPCWFLLFSCGNAMQVALLPCRDGLQCLDPYVKTLLSPFSHSCVKAGSGGGWEVQEHACLSKCLPLGRAFCCFSPGLQMEGKQV